MITIRYEEENDRSAAYDGEKEIGECTYFLTNRKWVINHTFVDENYGGQGIAKKLVAEIVDQARQQGIKIIPLCPFAKREFELRAEYADVKA
ncbi:MULTISPECIES: GNAT family N-acetyltransferase [Streptococcus]|uniref:N-acetyltransferase n=2 Tax=Streptococcus TaxID=1301 RepID=A0A934P875_9STRE|nr:MULTISPECIES: GNAT family N-acetyltransferase [Streptococcus]MBJ8325277.1 N-acetyltransferase [Streptococcus pacificus]MBJ8349091.1 N-acetyltransferase [Streptococcus zalophi]MCR8967758.1 N-acetyltransferase [Streptococcus zalophi]MCU9533661.1 N-acetyltransferase [Streptococcus sp. CSL10205-OR2]